MMLSFAALRISDDGTLQAILLHQEEGHAMSGKSAVISGVLALTACTSGAQAPPARSQPVVASSSVRPSSPPAAYGGGPRNAPLSVDAAVGRLIDAKCAQAERCAVSDTLNVYDTHGECVSK